MRTLVQVMAATLAGTAVVIGASACSRTTDGVVAQTTQPGPPLSSTRTPTASPGFPGLPGIPGLPDIRIPGLPTPGTSVPQVPAPPNSTEMSCEEFNGLDEATRVAVVREILAQENNPLGPNGENVGQILAEAACQFLPEARVSEVLLGGG